jgi:excinuclease ABC subunit A
MQIDFVILQFIFKIMTADPLANLDPHDFILIKGARVHNLKNLSVALPRNSLIVITGLSGSGKSSLAFDTLYADGQRRYVESLSAYARQFLGRMNKPEVDYIKGIAPAIAIEQKVNTRNPRSTVGTSTEIYEYLKLLYARIGKTFSPVSGQLVMRHTITDVVEYASSLAEGTRFVIQCPLVIKARRSIAEQLAILMQQGFTRISTQGRVVRIEEFLQDERNGIPSEALSLVIDRMAYHADDDEFATRVADSAQLAFYEGEGACTIESFSDNGTYQKTFTNRFELDGIVFEEPSVNLFSFNNPYGACKLCEGFGSIIGIDEDLVVPNKNLSIYDDAIACLKGEKMSEWKEVLVKNAYKFDFPIYKPFYELTQEQQELLWTGNEYFSGLNDFFKFVEEQNYKIQYRVMLSRYRGKTVCPDCKGTRLRKDANYVKVGGRSISELVLMPVSRALTFFSELKLSDTDYQIARRLLTEITNRLQFLEDVGLGYLTLNRLSSSLSGGESQRINLATSLGSSLVGSMYILDEPSIGLHPRDTLRLITVLKKLRDLGNTVIVVEHDEDIIRAADQIVDIGPHAGRYGGELVFQGTFDELFQDEKSLTGRYLSNRLSIGLPPKRRGWKDYIEVTGVREHNLKGISVKFPLRVLTCVTGVSGSGKTTLVRRVLYAALKKVYGGYADKTGKFDKLNGDYKLIGNVELVDQNPIGRSTRSNPATYVKAYDDIRQLFADQQLAQVRGYKPGYFSFNVPGGRCEECEGEGMVKIEMQFMADIYLTCESCNGKRFRDEVLDVKYRGYTITDILDMTVSDAILLFGSVTKKNSVESRILAKLQPLMDVGLGYLKLGQSSSTLSGGEAQRTKLAYFLAKGVTDIPTLFIFDEPTTGLHFHDIHKLLVAFHALIERGHSIIVIEHNLDVIKNADWIIDLGPEGGEEGGRVVGEGTPEEIAAIGDSYTGKYLQKKIRGI